MSGKVSNTFTVSNEMLRQFPIYISFQERLKKVGKHKTALLLLLFIEFILHISAPWAPNVTYNIKTVLQ